MKCINCGQLNPQEAKSCANCGLVFVAPTDPTPSNNSGRSKEPPLPELLQPPAPDAGNRPLERIICPNCQTSNNPNSLYCDYCSRLLPVLPRTGLGKGRWVTENILGEGGMGRVYLAFDRSSDSRVVVKELLDERKRPAEAKQTYLDYFQKEAQILGSLKGNKAVPQLINGVVSEGPRHYFVMEYIDGVDLKQLVEQRQRPLEVEQVIGYGISLCEVLVELHNRIPPVIHRDIKPDNLRLRKRDGSVTLLDFGIAKNLREGTTLTEGIGTFEYMPPEQLSKQQGQVGPRSDLYSLAATLYFLLSNTVPYEVRYKLPEALRSLNPEVPEELENIILANLEEAPEERYDNAMLLLKDLKTITMTQFIRCRTCSKLNDRRLVYCDKDGTALYTRKRRCKNPKCQADIPARAKFCPRCGSGA